ncbi:MAG TPA: hypothetical protein VMF64_12840 [Steroidobacteraceae bacterium]|nr:hypothetical protein [Steroidobacteraceae bacterium]
MTNELTARRIGGWGRPGWRALGAVLALSLAPAWPVLAWHLPWHHRAHRVAVSPSAPGLAIALAGQGTSAAAAVPQSWQRNTLLVDLTHLPGNGSATLTPPPNAGWPVRLAFRVQPGSIASLTIEGAQRVQYTLPARGAAMTLQLDPGVYVVKTPSLTLRWSAADDLPH